jgi:hypothetical protein
LEQEKDEERERLLRRIRNAEEIKKQAEEQREARKLKLMSA